MVDLNTHPNHMGPQFQYPEIGAITFRSPIAHRIYGAGTSSALFRGGSPIVPAPWQDRPRWKKYPTYDQEAVTEVLQRPPVLEEMDPRNLHASQPSVTLPGVNYYMDDPTYWKTGETYADRGNVGNRFPVVYSDVRGRNILLSGHHRATAALLRGEPLVARRVRGRF